MSEEAANHSSDEFEVAVDGGVLTIKSAYFAEGDENEVWKIEQIDTRRLLLTADEDQPGLGPATAGLATCSVEIFKDFLIGLINSDWSGVVAVDTGYGIKRVFFERGEIVFAASNVMDDRLGEVIYREDMITLDELTDSAAQVTKSRKFGQVLLTSNIFTNVDLWKALRLQVQTIIRSLFMVDRVFYHLDEGTGKAPTEVVFKRGSIDLIYESYAYGAGIRDFLSRLRSDSEVELLVTHEELQEKYKPGTFVGDLLSMVVEEDNVQSLLGKSKLMDINTVTALSMLVNRGYCRILPDTDSGARSSREMGAIKAKLDAYHFILQRVQKAFETASQPFPIDDVRDFAFDINPSDFRTFYVNPDGSVNKDCVNGMFAQCHANRKRIEFFLYRLESMIQFLLQVSGDSLEWKTAKQIREEYRAISA